MMKEAESEKPEAKRLPAVSRRRVQLLTQQLIKTEYLQPGQTLPLVIRPAVPDLDPIAWALENRELIKTQVLQHGALLFRDFNLQTPERFRQFIEAAAGELIEYRERSSPRSQVGERVYTSTDYPAEQSIFPHNEHSYALTFPLRLFFFCETPAAQGGETPLADTRKILARIDTQIIDRFREKKWRYVRNFGDGFGLPWQTVFQTTDRVVVEEYCRRARIECEWKEGNRLRTWQVREAIAAHPQTGESVWFNHATFFHVSTLERQLREALLSEFDEEDLPNNTYYGDGSPIEPEVLDKLRTAYRQEMVQFGWQKGDLVMLDNMLTAHARSPFEGERKVLFAMAEPFTRQDI
jgi:alpha-ketoglutarate-dependent taurine dioxygenase